MTYALVPLAWVLLLFSWEGARSLRALARALYFVVLGLCIRARIID